jgi:hypothetical protein
MSEVLERPRIDPRIARRWIEARRQEGRRRLRLVSVAAVVAVLAGLGIGSLYSPVFSTRHVRVTVDGPVGRTQILALTGLAHPPVMIEVHTRTIAARLDADPWLGDARVTKRWPSTVMVNVAVRAPVAEVAVGGQGAQSWAEVDPTGRVLAVMGNPVPGLPAVDGLGAPPGPGAWLPLSAGPAAAVGSTGADMAADSDAADVPRGAGAALAFLQALPPALRSAVQTFTVAPSGLSLVIAPPRAATGTVKVVLGDGSQLQAKVSALVTLMGQANLSGVTGLDLSVPDRPAALTARS